MSSVVTRGAQDALMGSADPPLAVHRFYGGRRHRHRRRTTEDVYRLGGSLGVGPARPAPVHHRIASAWSHLAGGEGKRAYRGFARESPF